MKKSEQDHNRICVLERKTKALCRTHGLQLVIDVFHPSGGVILALECGCRRSEKAS